MGDLVTDDALQLLADFRSNVPLPTEAVAEAVYQRAVQGQPRQPRRRFAGRRRLVPVGVVALLAFAAAAFAAVREAPWWQGGSAPVDPQAVVSVARDNMPADVRVADARTVATDGDSALVAVPLDETGYCLIPALDGHASLGASCVYSVTHAERGDSDSSETAVRARSGDTPARWLAFGRITDPRASKLDLGAFTVDLAPGGFFLVEIPDAQWASLGGTANRGAILDGSGQVLRRGCVNWGASPNGASSRFASTLWVDQPSGECTPQTLPPVPTIDLSQATKLFDVTLTQPFSIWRTGQSITFEKAPASDGRTCVVVLGPGLPVNGFGNGCGFRLDLPRSGDPPINPAMGTDLHHANGNAFYAWQITGSTDPSAGITKLTLTSGSASATVDYRDNFFFAQLPATTPGPRVGDVPLPDGPWVLTGYDAAGRQVYRVDLNALQKRNEPH